ncbi:excalibur calcium-binding domain-containing protein [Leptotrichia wadei]|nr:excalibur calcium-binding domain-containing protein [Leptotrichia wadei]
MLKIVRKLDQKAIKISKGEPGYARHLDRDRDGIACESK